MFVDSLTAKTRVRKTFLPFVVPSISDIEINEVVDTLRSGWLTTGPKTKLFEAKFTQYIGAKHAIAVHSGAAGLHLSLIAAGVTQGDEVIVPTITFAATANVVIHCGAKPILADVGDDLNIKVSEIIRLINPKTKAIIPVHFAGQPCALTEILSIAQRNKLMVIEDATQAIGAVYRGRKIGTISPITVFSFSPTHDVTTSEGGMVVTNNDEIAEKIKILRFHGIDRDTGQNYSDQNYWCYEINCPGYQYSMTDIQAAIGLCQLAKLDEFLKIRRHYAQVYTDAFRFLPEIILPALSSDSNHSWQLYVILLNLSKLRINRFQFLEALRYENIGASVHFIPLHLHPFYAKTYGYRLGDFPNAEWLYQRIVSLPLYPKMTQNDVNDTITAVMRIIKRMKK